MARVTIVNPPRRHKKRRHFTAAMRNLRKARAKLNPRRHHRRHHAARHKARRRSHRFVNPYAGTLAVLGNPRKRRHKHMARKRHHRHHRRSHSNPFSANALLATPKEMISSDNLMSAASVAAGFVLPNMAMNYLPATWRSTTITYYVSKVGTVVALTAVGSMVSKRIAKFILLGGSVSILLDLYTEWMSGKSPAPAVAPTTTTAPATSAFYGNLSAYYGGMVNDFDVP